MYLGKIVLPHGIYFKKTLIFPYIVRLGFSGLELLIFWTRQIFVTVVCHVLCTQQHPWSTCQRLVAILQVRVIKKISRHCQMSSWVHNHSWLRTTDLDGICTINWPLLCIPLANDVYFWLIPTMLRWCLHFANILSYQLVLFINP